ncbi:MAG: hypothetical protein ACSHXK_05600 [Oceanococcus sp.]
MTLTRVCLVVFKPAHLRRTGLIALLVGSWLTAINVGDQIILAQWSGGLLLKIAMNYLTPFVVANMGLLSRDQAA